MEGRLAQYLKEMMRVVSKVTGVIYIPQSAMGIDSDDERKTNDGTTSSSLEQLVMVEQQG